MEIFDTVTQLVGAEFREFCNKTCSQFKTRELPRETEARKRRAAKKLQSGSGNGLAQTASDGMMQSDSEPPLKTLNIDTYKHHSLGDYPSMIRKYGTTDSYSTERVSFVLPSFALRHT